MPWRPYHYHVYHRDNFDALPAWASAPITVPGTPPLATETMTMYSLKKDMDQLRVIGAQRGIVDASVTDVGKSYKGKQLWALKVGNGAAHKVLFTGCHHAREWISVEIPYLVAEYLILNYRPDPVTDTEKRIKHLLMNREIWFVPCCNPDGHDYTMRDDRTWRPNRNYYVKSGDTIDRSAAGQPNVTFSFGRYTGVDINRNYATARWGVETFRGANAVTSRNPADSGPNSTWCGPSAASEPETAALQAVVGGGVRAAISYHSFSEFLLAPDAKVANGFLDWVGQGMQGLIAAAGHNYTYGTAGPPDDVLYAATGSHMDYCFEHAADRPSYTPEVRPAAGTPAWPPGTGFSGLPENEIEPTFKENLGAALAMINCAGHDNQAPPLNLNATTGSPATRLQAVRHCWQVFQGWPVPP